MSTEVKFALIGAVVGLLAEYKFNLVNFLFPAKDPAAAVATAIANRAVANAQTTVKQ